MLVASTEALPSLSYDTALRVVVDVSSMSVFVVIMQKIHTVMHPGLFTFSLRNAVYLKI